MNLDMIIGICIGIYLIIILIIYLLKHEQRLRKIEEGMEKAK